PELARRPPGSHPDRLARFQEQAGPHGHLLQVSLCAHRLLLSLSGGGPGVLEKVLDAGHRQPGRPAGPVIRRARRWRVWIVPPRWLDAARRGPRWPARTARAGPFRLACTRP